MNVRATEEWIFTAAESLEAHGLLGDFCDQIGYPTTPDLPVYLETVWPNLRRRYLRLNGAFDTDRARREMLGFEFVITPRG